MKYAMKRLLLLAVGVGAILAAGGALAGPVLVAHPGVPADALSQGEIQKIFLGKTANWSDGSRVVLGTLGSGDVSNAFFKAYVKKSPKQFKTFWKKAVFSGTGEMPGEFGSEAELVAFVAATPGAVGYVGEAAATDGVKVIATQ